jgi:hypothetical protein
MNYPVPFTVDKNIFVNGFLNALSRCTEQAMVSIKKDQISSLISTPNDLILYAKINGPTSIINDDELKFNIGSTKRLYSILNNIDEDNIDLSIETNHIKYTSTDLKFKYFLLDDSLASKVPLNVSKVENFAYGTTFTLSFDKLQTLLKHSSFSQTNKIYISTVDKKVITELNDLTKQNVDTISINIADSYVGKDITDAIPFELELFRNFLAFKQDISVKINHQYKVSIYDIDLSPLQLRYIALSLVK